MTEHTDGNGIVVGVDGSAASMAALRWAAEQAIVLHADLVAVHAWEPAANGHAPYAPMPAGPTVAQELEQATQVLATTVREALGPRTGDTVRRVVREGLPARVLLQQARGARLWPSDARHTATSDCPRSARWAVNAYVTRRSPW